MVRAFHFVIEQIRGPQNHHRIVNMQDTFLRGEAWGGEFPRHSLPLPVFQVAPSFWVCCLAYEFLPIFRCKAGSISVIRTHLDVACPHSSTSGNIILIFNFVGFLDIKLHSFYLNTDIIVLF